MSRDFTLRRQFGIVSFALFKDSEGDGLCFASVRLPVRVPHRSLLSVDRRTCLAIDDSGCLESIEIILPKEEWHEEGYLEPNVAVEHIQGDLVFPNCDFQAFETNVCCSRDRKRILIRLGDNLDYSIIVSLGSSIHFALTSNLNPVAFWVLNITDDPKGGIVTKGISWLIDMTLKPSC